MCGITAVIDLRRPVERATLEPMVESLRHRGPDDEGIVVSGSVGLGHTRLAVIDLESGQQPMEAGGSTIIYNGEVYNYQELRQELVAAGHTFRTTSDTEVILHWYLEHGVEGFRHLRGMFAFVIHDTVRQRIVAARDHIGIKPLYWYHTDGLTVYGSEIKALLRHPEIVAEPNYAGLGEYLTFQFLLGETTLFRGISKLEPGTFQVLDLGSGTITTTRYWEPDFATDMTRSADAFDAEIHEALAETVRLHLRSDVPVGCHVSGGLDSAIVTMLASRHLPSLDAFSGRFLEGPAYDESAYARDVAGAAGARFHDIIGTEREFVDCFPTLIYHLDEPVAGPGVYPQYLVARTAAQHVTVTLGGQGGDEIFGGYVRYVVAYLEQALKGAILETNEEGMHIVSLASIIPNLPALRQYVPMLQQFWRQGVFEPMDRRYFRLIDRSGRSLSLYSQDFRETYDSEEMFARFQQTFNRPDTSSYFNKMTNFDLVASLPALLHVEDRVSMAWSMESRVPLVDVRLAELLATTPPALKFQGGQLKHSLRSAAAGLVPESVLQRKDKMGFPVPLHEWRDGQAGEMVRDLLLDPNARTRDILDRNEVEKLTTYDGAFSRRLWGLMSLEQWFRTFIDQPSSTH